MDLSGISPTTDAACLNIALGLCFVDVWWPNKDESVVGVGRVGPDYFTLVAPENHPVPNSTMAMSWTFDRFRSSAAEPPKQKG